MSISDLELTFAKNLHGKYTLAMKLKRDWDDSPQALAAQATEIDLNTLQQKRDLLDFEEYGVTLSAQVFSNQVARDHFIRFSSDALDNVRDLRIRVVVTDEAAELHQVLWETLREPLQGQRLSTMDRVWLTRHILSTDMRPTSVEEREKIRALVVVSNPTDLGNYKLAAIDTQGEINRAKEALTPTQVTELSPPAATLNNLLAGIRDGADIIYLACHGILAQGEPILFLQKEDGSADKVKGKEFILRLGELHKLPRLIVLASCQSAGSGHEKALTALGPLLASIGIPAVLAMQGNISMETVKQFAPEFFRELTRHGQIDHALAVARSMVQSRHDFWVPVLFLRSESGKLWTLVRSRPSTRREVPTLLPYLADRKAQEECLDGLLKRCETQKPLPIVSIVHGDDLQAHDMFLERIQYVCLPKMAGFEPGRVPVTVFDLPWPAHMQNAGELPTRLTRTLADQVLHREEASCAEIQNALARYGGPVMIATHLLTDDWMRHKSGILPAYLDYWQNWPALLPRQRLLVFLFLTHKTPEHGLLKKSLYSWRKRSIFAQLNHCAFEHYDRLLGMALPELADISRTEAEDWARNEARAFCNGDLPLVLRKIREVYENPAHPLRGDRLPMELLAENLRSILQACANREEIYA